ncbi:MAG: methyltransferase domain-containing protein [Planctomycetota bacterium]
MSWEERREGWRARGVADGYDRVRFSGPLDRLKHRNDARRVLGLLARVGPAPLSVLDVPVGTGRMVGDLEGEGHRVTGVDLSAAMLGAGGGAAGGGAVLGEIERLPFADGAFDAAVSLRFLFHARDPDVRARLLTELRRVAGALVVHERCAETRKHRSRLARGRRGTRPAPTAAEFEAELRAAGWRQVRAERVSRLFSDKVLVLAVREDS